MVFLFAPVLAVAAWPGDAEWTARVEGRGLTRFVHHGVERAAESLQPSAWLESESLKLGTWMNFPVSDTRSHEFALVAAYTHRFEQGPEFRLDVTHYHLRDARNGHPGHTAELTVSLGQPAGPGRAVVRYTRDVKRQADVAELAYEGEWALKSLGAFLHYRAYLGAKHARNVLPNLTGAKIADGYAFHGLDLTLPYRVGGSTMLTAGLHYAGTQGQRPYWSPVAARVGAKVWATLGATYEF